MDEIAAFPLYLRNLEKLKIEDEGLSYLLLSFLLNLFSEKPKTEKLSNQLRKICRSIDALNKEYSEITYQFNKCKEPLLLYATFLIIIGSNDEKSDFLIKKLDYIDHVMDQNAGNSSKMTFFDDSAGILLISSERDTFGKIKYANFKASEILGYHASEMIEINISNLVPVSFCNKSVLTYLESQTRLEIDFPKSIFLKNSDGYLINCKLRVALAAVANSKSLIVVFKEMQFGFQLVLLNEKGDIQGHSKRFCQFLAVENTSIVGSNISMVFPMLNFDSLVENMITKTRIVSKTVYLVKSFQSVGNLKLAYILFDYNKHEIED